MSRDALNWLITIPTDGTLPLNGIAPALVEWQSEVHPAVKLQDQGLSLVKLELFYPEPKRISRLLLSLDLDGPLCVSRPLGERTPYLVAHINTPQGLRLLSAPKPSF